MALGTNALSAALLALALTTSACGSDGSDGSGGADAFADQSVEDIKADTIADMKKLESMRMVGTIKLEEGELGLDLAMGKAGACAGSVDMAGGKAEFINATDATYVKADEAFWENTAGAQAGQLMQLIGDKWAKLPAQQSGFAEFCDIGGFIDSLEEDEDEKAEVTKDGTEDVDGTEAVVLLSKADDGDTRVWISAEGDHHLLKMSNQGGESPGEFEFSEFDEPVGAEAPPEAEVVDMTQQ